MSVDGSVLAPRMTPPRQRLSGGSTRITAPQLAAPCSRPGTGVAPGSPTTPSFRGTRLLTGTTWPASGAISLLIDGRDRQVSGASVRFSTGQRQNDTLQQRIGNRGSLSVMLPRSGRFDIDDAGHAGLQGVQQAVDTPGEAYPASSGGSLSAVPRTPRDSLAQATPQASRRMSQSGGYPSRATSAVGGASLTGFNSRLGPLDRSIRRTTYPARGTTLAPPPAPVPSAPTVVPATSISAAALDNPDSAVGVAPEAQEESGFDRQPFVRVPGRATHRAFEEPSPKPSEELDRLAALLQKRCSSAEGALEKHLAESKALRSQRDEARRAERRTREECEALLAAATALRAERDSLVMRHRSAEKRLQRYLSENKETHPQASEIGVCIVCLDKAASWCFVPCGHIALCGECARESSGVQCPCCRSPAQQLIRVFLP